jgi:hypothetical protein
MSWQNSDLVERIKIIAGLGNAMLIPLIIVCNLLSICIYSQNPIRRHRNVWFYYRAISVCNICTVILFLTIMSPDHNLADFSDLTCKFTRFIVRFIFQLNSWLHVLCTLDRAVVILNLYRLQRLLSQRRNMYLILTGLVCILCIANSVNFMHRLAEDPDNGIIYCTAFNPTIRFYRDLIGNLSRLVIPFLLMLIGNTVLIVEFTRVKRSLNLSSAALQRRKARDRQFLLMIILINAVFLITQLPITVVQIIINVLKLDIDSVMTKRDDKMNMLVVALIISTYMCSLNFLLPFFVNLKFNGQFLSKLGSVCKT